MYSGVGAVLFDYRGCPIEFFPAELGGDMLRLLNPNKKQTIIFEREFFALFCALALWGESSGPAIVTFTDNNAVRDAIISCHANNDVAKRMLIATPVVETQQQLMPWYARVPTDSNTADAPSRLEINHLVRMGAAVRECSAAAMWDSVSSLSRTWGGNQATA